MDNRFQLRSGFPCLQWGPDERHAGTRVQVCARIHASRLRCHAGSERRASSELVKHDDMSVRWPAGVTESSSFLYWLPSVCQLASRFDRRGPDGVQTTQMSVIGSHLRNVFFITKAIIPFRKRTIAFTVSVARH